MGHSKDLPEYLRQLISYNEKEVRAVIGLHSGTSADGPTAAVVKIRGSAEDTQVHVMCCETYEYPSPLRERIFDIFSRETATVDRVTQADVAIGEFFAEAAQRIARKAGVALADVDLVVSSGQVVYQVIEGQRPEHRWLGDRAITSFLDLGAGAVIAERTGVNTVSNLRQRDIAAGGLGVPTVTYGDWAVFRHPKKCRVILNIGGIANPTVIPASARVEDVFAFDCGPGNMIIDGLIGWMTQGRQAYDEGGAMAAKGTLNKSLLDELMEDRFIRQVPPKGAARQLYGHQYAAKVRERAHAMGLSDTDLLATVTALSVESIAYAFEQFVAPRTPVDQVYVAGGGALNRTMMRMLAERLAPLPVETTEALGIPVEAREVVAMIALANETVQGRAGNAPGATGSLQRVICGDITPGRVG